MLFSDHFYDLLLGIAVDCCFSATAGDDPDDADFEPDSGVAVRQLVNKVNLLALHSFEF